VSVHSSDLQNRIDLPDSGYTGVSFFAFQAGLTAVAQDQFMEWLSDNFSFCHPILAPFSQADLPAVDGGASCILLIHNDSHNHPRRREGTIDAKGSSMTVFSANSIA
jgi:hypothetical protein